MAWISPLGPRPWLKPGSRAPGVVGGAVTLSSAAGTTSCPTALLTTTEYAPASFVATARSLSIDREAPAIGWPLKCHWYDACGAPETTTLNSVSNPAGTFRLVGADCSTGAKGAGSWVYRRATPWRGMPFT